jgi:hypothetical protein
MVVHDVAASECAGVRPDRRGNIGVFFISTIRERVSIEDAT